MVKGGQQMRIRNINEKIAEIVSATTGNMWFFWASLIFIVILRLSHPPALSDLLLNIENDLQLLLLAANAVVGAKQIDILMQMLKKIEAEEEEIEKICKGNKARLKGK
jgi:hypothetical protein